MSEASRIDRTHQALPHDSTVRSAPDAPHQAHERLGGKTPQASPKHPSQDQVEADFSRADTPSVAHHLADAYRDPGKVDARHPWDNTLDTLKGATNAHITNSPSEMRSALGERTDWLEGDMHPGPDLRMGHDGPTGIPFGQWLQDGFKSGRGIKLEIKGAPSDPHDPKDVAAMNHILDEIEKNNVPDNRLMFNMNAHAMRAFGKTIHERFPEAILTMSGATPRLDTGTLLETARGLSESGIDRHYLNFSIRNDQADAETVKQLKQYGTVSIWNDPKLQLPWSQSIEEQTRELRSRGVDGIIDLRTLDPLDLVEKGFDVAKNKAEGFVGGVKDKAEGIVKDLLDL